MNKKVSRYFSHHPVLNALSHLLLGVGIGILITRPLVGIHPIRVAAVFIILGICGHLYPLVKK